MSPSMQFTAGVQPGKGPLVQRLRLWSGLILFGYVCFHYVNHSLGHVSVEAMESLLDFQESAIGNPVGMAILYGALLLHSSLGIWRIVTIRTWRRPFWIWAQIALGIAIPWLLVSHLTYTRGAQTLLGVEIDYHHELLLLWPGAALKQSLLLLIVWAHGCIGIHFWLRLRTWYPTVFPALASLALLIPAISLTGWISAARSLLQRLQFEARQSPAAREAYEAIVAQNRFIGENLRSIEDAGQWLVLAILGTALLIMGVRWYSQRIGRKVRVNYSGGPTVTSAPGQTLLEISHQWRIPHMSVCGGRARCSTCRTVILSGSENLSPPTEAETSLLKKFDAGDEIRLACQCRVSGDVTVRPMIQAKSAMVSPRRADPLGWGMERELAVMFVDVRGFSRISENALPYDVVYILNSLFDEVGHALETSNGYIDKFMGDGIMALFGLARQPADACRDAVTAALEAHAATARASRALSQHLSEPMRIGVGVHFGQVVVGRVGKTSDQTAPSRLTAIGDTVNVASRLESSSKDFECGLVVSALLLEKAGISVPEEIGTRTVIKVRNISEPVDIVAINDLEKMRDLLDEARAATRDKSAGSQPMTKPQSRTKTSASRNRGADRKPSARKSPARTSPATRKRAARPRPKKKADD